MARRTIKIPEDVFERHNERREEAGATWADWIDGQAPNHLERQADAFERQADALEVIAGTLLLRASDDRQLNAEALLREARFHYEPDKPHL